MGLNWDHIGNFAGESEEYKATLPPKGDRGLGCVHVKHMAATLYYKGIGGPAAPGPKHPGLSSVSPYAMLGTTLQSVLTEIILGVPPEMYWWSCSLRGIPGDLCPSICPPLVLLVCRCFRVSYMGLADYQDLQAEVYKTKDLEEIKRRKRGAGRKQMEKGQVNGKGKEVMSQFLLWLS